MAKVTTKLQVTIPKALADQYGIAPGDRIHFEAAGPLIRLVPQRSTWPNQLSLEERLRLFDAGTARQRERAKHLPTSSGASGERDWSRDDLYTRGDSG